MRKRTLLLSALGLSLACLVTACAPTPARTQAAGPDWSRGVLLGESSFNEAVGFHAEADGERVHLAWGEVSGAGDRIRYLQLDGEATVVRDIALPLPVRSPHQLRLLPDGQGGLVMCYLSGIAESRRLHSAHLDSDGQVLARAEEISGLSPEVDDYTAVATPSGIEVFWSNEWLRTRGLYHLRMDRSGAPLTPSRLLVPGGYAPHAQLDRDGRLHLTWLQEPGYYEMKVYYATYDIGQSTLGEPALVASFNLRSKATRYGPVLALSEDRVHIFWSWQYMAPGGLYFGSDALAGEGELHYVSFPTGAPEQAEGRTLVLRADVRPHYGPAQGIYAYSQLAPTGPGGGQVTVDIAPPGPWLPMRLVSLYRERDEKCGIGTSLVCMPAPAPGQRDEVALGLVLLTSTRSRTSLQIGVAYLADGEEKGYQLAARGRRALVRPVLAADERGQLHLAWLESAGFNRYQVYYASTRPEVRRALGRPGADDVVTVLQGLGWNLVQAASIMPASILWVFLPLILLLGYSWLRPEARLGRAGPSIALAAAILLHVLGKLFLLPANIIAAAPLVERLPASVVEVYQFALPAAVLFASLGALALYGKRSQNRSLLVAYLVFAGSDVLLTSLLYAPGMLS
ncbi:MAG: hypothetical protein QME94_14680 [Anaerolineae bacterium]|nr:hypothetical protein [Anaerolineae bacterium]